MNKQTEEFLLYLKNERNFSEKTIASYKYDVEKFFSFLFENSILMDQVSLQNIRCFLTKEIENNITKRSCQRRMSSLKHFYSFMEKVGYVKDNPFLYVSSIKQDKRLPKVLFEEDIDKLFNANRNRNDNLSIRDQAILEVLFSSGIRAAELVSLDIQSVDVNRREMRIIGKGNKERVVLISNECQKSIKEYLKEVRPRLFEKSKIHGPALFLNNNGNRLTNRGLEYILRQIEEKTGVDLGLHPHMLRHSFATFLLSKGADLISIQKLLGHANLNATQIYTHVSIEKMKETYSSYHPRTKKKDD